MLDENQLVVTKLQQSWKTLQNISTLLIIIFNHHHSPHSLSLMATISSLKGM